MESLGDGDVASVGEGGDDQTVRAAQELVLVLEVYVGDGDLTDVIIFVEVEPALFGPLEIVDRFDMHHDQLVEDVPLMDMDRDNVLNIMNLLHL